MTPPPKRVALAAQAAAPDPDVDWRPLRPALVAAGLEPHVTPWDDPAVAWDRFDLVVPLFAWDYVTRRPDFLAWTESVSQATRLVNAPGIIRWNSDKRYLADLEALGIPVVPTVWVPPGASWHPPAHDYVVKPSVASGGREAARYVAHGVEDGDRHVRRLHEAGQTAMVQAYQASIDVTGETGLVFLGDRYSHAVAKSALLRADVGVTEGLWKQAVLAPVEARHAQLLLAEGVVQAVVDRFGPTAYARVDVVDDAEGRPQALEVELIEPALSLAGAPGAAERLAAVLAGHVRR